MSEAFSVVHHHKCPWKPFRNTHPRSIPKEMQPRRLRDAPDLFTFPHSAHSDICTQHGSQHISAFFSRFFFNQLAVSPLSTALVKALRSQPTLDPEESFWPVPQTKHPPITKSDLHDLLFHHVTAALRKRCVNAEHHCLAGSVKCPRGGRSAIFVSMATS